MPRYLLYQYKRTNTDAEAALKVHTEKDMARVLALLLPGIQSS